MNEKIRSRLAMLKIQSIGLASQAQSVFALVKLIQEQMVLNREILKLCDEITDPNAQPVPGEAQGTALADCSNSSSAGGAGRETNGGSDVERSASDLPGDIPK